MHFKNSSILSALFRASLVLAVGLPLAAQSNVTTQHNDIGRTGQNLTETILTPATVNTANFGKLFSVVVDGQVYAQPLYMSSVTISGTVHHVLFVATEHDSVYALDAGTGAQLWKASLLDTAHGATAGATTDPETDTGCSNITTEYGISGTPVIDAATGTIYVVSETFENNYPVLRLHALDITTGNEKFGGPTALAASLPGTGTGSSNGLMTFDPKWQNQRSGLLELNGNIYIGFGSHCDYSAWHGWILGYNATTLAQTAKFLTTPNGYGSGVWMSGSGLAADTQGGIGRIFPATGNGTYDATLPYGTNTMDYGDDILRLETSSSGSFAVKDAFTPSTQASLSSNDQDLGSGGVLVLPDQPGANSHLLVQLGKPTWTYGNLYLVNRDNMGGYSTSANSVVQQLSLLGGLWSMPAYWNGNLYVWPSQGNLLQYPLTNGMLSSAPSQTSPQAQNTNGGFNAGVTPSISANGTQNGIVWSIDPTQSPQVLYANNAANVSQLLYSSVQNSARDSAGSPQKFVVPTIADGRVFVAAASVVYVYGILPPAVPDYSLSAFPPVLSVVPGASVTTQINVTSINGFTGAVTLTAGGLPSGVTATFTPLTSGAGTTVTLTAAANASLITSNTVTIIGTSGSLSHSTPITLSVAATPSPVAVNMLSSFNVYGIFNTGSTVTNGGLDSAGYAYSANLLGSSAQSASGVSFYFGPAGTADAVSSATVPLPAGSFATLNLAATGVFGAQQNQTFVVNYTDGSSSSFTQNLSDWLSSQNYSGESVASSMIYRLMPAGGTQTATTDLYAYSFALNSAKTVASITLPNNRAVVVMAISLSGEASAGVQPATAASLAPGPNTVTFKILTPGLLNSPAVFTEGVPSTSLSNPDFTLIPGSTTCSGYVSGTSCSVSVQFTPQIAGLRRGAVKLFDASNNLLSTAFIYGVGSGSTPVSSLAAAKTFPSTGSPSAVAIDGAGNLFYTDRSASQLLKLTSAGTATVISLGVTLNTPMGLALDGAGNLYVSDAANNRVLKLPYGSSTATALSISGLNYPEGLAVDGSGNLFIANDHGSASTGIGNILEIAANSNVQTTVYSGGLEYPTGIALDSTGDIFFSDWNNNRVVEIPASGGAVRSLGTGLNLAGGVAVDAGGNVFIADQVNGRVVEVPATGSQFTLATGLSSPFGLALDGRGNLFVACLGPNSVNGSVVEIPILSGLTSQTITFNSIATQTAGATLSLTASSTSGLPVTFTSSTAGVCTVSGTSVTFVAAGTCTLTASQSGNGTYSAAPSVTQSFTVSQPAVVTTGSPGVTSQTLTSLRNNYSGFVGMQFMVGPSPIVVSSLGRFVATGNTGTHLLKIVNADGSDLAGASASVTITGTAGQYQYAALSSSVQLQANTSYFLVSQETANGDKWYDISAVSTAGSLSVTAPVYTDVSGRYVPVTGLSGQSYVPVNLLFSLPTSLSVTIVSPKNAATVGGSGVPVTVSVTGPLVNLQLQVDGVNQGAASQVTSAQGPVYSLTLNTGTLTNASHTLTVVASDATSKTVTSAAVTVTVSNASASGSSATPFVIAQTPGSVRNNYSGFVGFEFTTGSSAVTVSSLGRFVAPNNSGVHLLKLVSSNGTDISGASVSISLAGATAGQYLYGYLPSSVVLPANNTYYLVSQETAGGDAWYDIGPVTTAASAAVNGPVYVDSQNNYVFVKGLTGQSYVPVSFLYSTPIAASVAVINTPANGSQVYASAVPVSVGVSGTFTSLQLQVDSVNNGAAIVISGAQAPSYELTLNASKLTTGAHTLTVVASNGQTTSSSAGVVISVSSPTDAAASYITSQTASSLRNNYSGFVGMAINVGPTPLLVNSLGRMVVSGNTATHILKLVEANGTDVVGGSVSVSLTGATAGQYQYASLPLSVTLLANTTYYLVSQETSGGDMWFDIEPVASTAAAQVTSPTYTDNNGIYNVVRGLPGFSYVPVNFQYQ